jgi:hypothetical protein
MGLRNFMIDLETKQRLMVRADGDSGPYLLVPLDQVPDVQHVLQRHRIAHSLAEDAIRLDGKPTIAIIDFGRQAPAEAIQAALDAA